MDGMILLHVCLLKEAIGIYLIIAAIVMTTRVNSYKKLLAELSADNFAVVLASYIGLMFGIFLVLSHNVWVLNVEVLLTLIAWFVLIKSLLWISFPECMLCYTKKLYSGCWYYVSALVVAAVGILLLAEGLRLKEFISAH